MSVLEIVLALVMVVGLVGIVVPLMPGSLLIVGAVLVWAINENQAVGWVVLAVVVAQFAVGVGVKYLVPGRRLQRAGVPNRTLLLGGLVGVVGFFVVPVVGLPLGFVLGIYLSELQRGAADAWGATVEALKAVGFGILIELAFGVLSIVVWLVGTQIA